MKKFLSKVLLLFLLLPIIFSKVDKVYAGTNFTISNSVTYQVQTDGKTIVSNDINIKNNLSTVYATSYSISLKNIEVGNVRSYSINGTQYEVKSEKKDDSTIITIKFPDTLVGKDASREFVVAYENSDFAKRTGEVWEVNIPKIEGNDSFSSYNVYLKIPSSLGQMAYLSPNALNTVHDENFTTYSFSKEELSKTGVTAGFGQFQVFNFSLNYHLENPLAITSDTSIALPPDTAFQKVYFDQIRPEPYDVKTDDDGNWIAEYRLAPRQRVDIVATGNVQIFSSQRNFPLPSKEVLNNNLKKSDYWQVDDPRIIDLAKRLRTPEEIYNYVVSTLSYDYNRVSPNEDRMGAIKALDNPTHAICMEYTDLFVALARAVGIPAREINGFSYTENPDVQPLSLTADVLHAWPEYYDDRRQAWIPVDPTWGSTTGGVDFFNKLDLRHFTFVVHGESAIKPYAPGSYKLGTNPQKDVFVSFGKLSPKPTIYPDISATFKQTFPFMPSKLQVTIRNKNSSAYYSLNPIVYFDGKETYRDFIPVLPPFANFSMNVNVPYSFLGQSTPGKIKVEVLGSSIEVPTNKNRVIINSLVVIFTLFIISLIAIIIRMKWIRKLLIPYLKIQEFISSKMVKK